jgi:hypothetical protein
MTEEKKEVNVDELISQVTSKVQDKLDTTLSKVNEKVDSLKVEEKEETWPLTTDESDEDGYVSQAQVKKMLAQQKKELEQIAAKTSAKVVDNTLNEQKVRRTRDEEALTSFPMLNKYSPHYDQGFVNAVETEMSARIDRGRAKEDVDLLYDSAAVVKATSTKWNKTMDEQATEQTRKFNNAQGDFSVKGKSKADSWRPTAGQLRFADKLGLTKDQLEKHFKRKALG